jgi:hypothetical protein
MSTVVLDDISDVNFSFVAPAQGDILYFDGSDWVNFPLKIENSGDVVLSSITAGDFLKWDGSDWVNDAIDLGTDTVGDYVTSLVAGTGITLSNNSGEGATPTVEIGQDVATTANVTFNDLILTGDLTVQGNTTTLETATLQVEDNIVVLNYGQTTPTLDAGIQIERGSGTDVTLRWNESLDYWDFTNDGTTYYKLITALDDISDVDLTSTAPTSGDVLKFDGTNWVPDAIDLGTDTTGDFVQSLVAGTGVTLANNSGENATPTIAIGQSVETTDDVTFNTLTATAGVITLTSSGAPTSTIADGALAVDTTNDTLYVRSNGSWVESSGGGASVTVSDAAPGSPTSGDLWYESDTGSMFVYYDDGNTTQWVEVGGSSVVAMTVADTPPSTPSNGDMWFESDTGKTYVYYTDGTSSQWVEVGAASSSASIITVSDTAPSAPDNGTLWYDSATSALLVYYNDGNSSQWIEVIGDAVIAMSTSDAAPSSPTNGDLWFETDTGKTYVYYNDGSSGQWIEIGAASAGVTITPSSTAPSSPNVSDLWYETTTGKTYIYYDGGWQAISGGSTTITSSSTDAAILLMEIGT